MADEKAALLSHDRKFTSPLDAGLPVSVADAAPRRSSARRHAALAVLALCLIAVRGSVWLLAAPRHAAIDLHCPQAEPAPRSDVSRAFDDAALRGAAVERLQGAVRVATVSYDDLGPPEEDVRWLPFKALRRHLEASFPTVFATATVETVSTYTLILTINGTDAGLKPTVLTAHQDCVPVYNAEQWSHPPFAAEIADDGYMYGRGTADDKSVLVGKLEAVEQLLLAGWRPRRTLVLVAHQDEEVRGHRGSALAAPLLLERYGEDGAAVVLDEGAGADVPLFGRTWSSPAIAERGYADLRIETRIPGGHSAFPLQPNALRVLAELVDAYDAAPRPAAELTRDHPMTLSSACYAQHGEGKGAKRLHHLLRAGDLRGLSRFWDEAGWRRFRETSWTPTVLSAGSKVNVVPPTAIAFFNHRPGLGDSLAAAQRRLAQAIEPVLKRYNLTEGADVVVEWSEAEQASAVSSVRSPAWDALVAAGRSVVPDALFAPSLLLGYTDVRRYAKLSRAVYRWNAARGNDPHVNAHGTDERVHVDAYIGGVQVYVEFVLAMDRLESDEGL